MAAVLPASVAICGECFPLVSAGEIIDRFLIDLLRMFTPPLDTASITAEDTCFHVLPLNQLASALPALTFLICLDGSLYGLLWQIPSAKGYHGIPVDTEAVRDFSVAATVCSQQCYRFFLYWCHLRFLLGLYSGISHMTEVPSTSLTSRTPSSTTIPEMI